MSRTITLVKKNPDVTGQKAKVVNVLNKLGRKAEFAAIKKACRSMDARALRARVRELAAEKIISIKRAA